MKLTMKSGMTEFDAWQDLFTFHKTYGTPEPGVDTYWDAVLKEACRLNKKYTGTCMEAMVSNCLIALTNMWHSMARGGKA